MNAAAAYKHTNSSRGFAVATCNLADETRAAAENSCKPANSSGYSPFTIHHLLLTIYAFGA